MRKRFLSMLIFTSIIGLVGILILPNTIMVGKIEYLVGRLGWTFIGVSIFGWLVYFFTREKELISETSGGTKK